MVLEPAFEQETVWVSDSPEGLRVVIREGVVVDSSPDAPYKAHPPAGRVVKSYVLSASPVVVA